MMKLTSVKKALFAFLLLSQIALAKNSEEKVDFSNPIDVSGKFKRNLTPAQKIKLLRKKMEKRTQLMVQKQLENIRLKEEQKLHKKLRAMMNQQLRALSQIQ